MKERQAEAWVLASPNGKKFLAKGTGNSELDGDYVVDHLREASFLISDPSEIPFKLKKKRGSNDWVSTGERHPISYYCGKPASAEDRELGRFMQTAVGMQVTITLHPPDVSRLGPIADAIQSTGIERRTGRKAIKKDCPCDGAVCEEAALSGKDQCPPGTCVRMN